MVEPTVAAALQAARLHIGPFEARLLLRHVLGCSAVWLETHHDDGLSAANLQRYDELVARRVSGEPVAYLLGVREFYGREFAVAPGVLIPRPETELLVSVALSRMLEMAAPRVLDLGTGSGCVAITLALECPAARLSAVEAWPAAARIARANALRLGAPVSFHAGSWFAAVAGQHFDVIVSNPPYIAADDVHLGQGDLRFEPPTALASGSDGLDDLRQIIAAAPDHLAAGGSLWLEHGYDQGEAVLALLQAAGFTQIEQHRDLAGIPRVCGGRWIDHQESQALK